MGLRNKGRGRQPADAEQPTDDAAPPAFELLGRGPGAAAPAWRPDARVAAAGSGSSEKAMSTPSAAEMAAAASEMLGGGEGTGILPSGKREISQIKGLNVKSHQVPSNLDMPQVRYAMFDPARGRGRRVLLAVLAVCGLVVGGVFAVFPEVRHVVTSTVTQQWRKLSVLIGGKPGKRNSTVIVESGPEDGSEPAPVMPVDATSRPGAPGPGCAGITTRVADGMGAAAVRDRVALAECHLTRDDPVRAEEALRPVLTRLVSAGDARLNGTGTDGTLADAHQVMVSAYLRQGKSREAGELLRNSCLQWQRTNACVSKLMVVADRRQVQSGNDGINRMFGVKPRLSAKAEARIWLAGALIAQTEGKTAVADQRYVMALGAAPRSSLALRKAIHEAQAMDLFLRGDLKAVARLVPRALNDLKGVDAGARIKLKTLGDIATTTDRRRAVQRTLTREEISFKVRGDAEMIEALGPEVIRYALEPDYLRLLQRARDHYRSTFRAPGTVLRRLAAWEIRTMVAKRDFDGALARLGTYKSEFGADVFSDHMRGVVYHLTSGHERYQLLAAREFQAALRQRQSWESLYGLGVTLTRGGRTDQAASVIKQLDQIVTSSGQRYWVEMLKAEWYIAKQNLPGARRIIDQWRTAAPANVTPLRLDVAYHERLGKVDRVQDLKLQVDDLARERRFEGTKEGFASPLGPMALAQRPID